MKLILCPACGFDARAESPRCTHCGQALNSTASAPNTAAARVDDFDRILARHRRKQRMGWIVTAFILVGGALAWLLIARPFETPCETVMRRCNDPMQAINAGNHLCLVVYANEFLNAQDATRDEKCEMILEAMDKLDAGHLNPEDTSLEFGSPADAGQSPTFIELPAVDIELGQIHRRGAQCAIDLKVSCADDVVATVVLSGINERGDVIAKNSAEVVVRGGPAWTQITLNRSCRSFRQFRTQAGAPE